MSAKLDGVLYELNSERGTNQVAEETDVFGSGFPATGFTLMRGNRRTDGSGIPVEINIWIKDSDFAVGTYNFDMDNNQGGGTYAEIIDLTPANFDFLLSTRNGSVTIASIDTTNRTISGTFEFSGLAIADDDINNRNFSVTEGTFR